MRKIISIVLSVGLLFQQGGLLYAAGEINLANYLSQAKSAIVQPDVFQPARLRYISYDINNNDFKLLLDKGNAKLNDATQELFNYFLIGLALPNDTFWVNLRPDAPENIINPLLEKTDIGKIFLEADLQLKKDTASLTSPQNPEGKQYWDKLYKKAGELFGSENITIPTITRPWIVPNEVIVRETEDSAYIYKATLKVMLEEDYLGGMKDGSAGASGRGTIDYSFNDPRLKELNEYSTRLIRETIIPKLTKEINSSKRYAKLRQVYYSLVLARWFKQKYQGQPVGNGLKPFPTLDSGDLTNLTSQEPCDKQAYFQAYQKSFKDGEYNLKETVATPFGQSIRSYVSGGISVNKYDIGRFRVGAKSDKVDDALTSGSPILNPWGLFNKKKETKNPIKILYDGYKKDKDNDEPDVVADRMLNVIFHFNGGIDKKDIQKIIELLEKAEKIKPYFYKPILAIFNEAVKSWDDKSSIVEVRKKIKVALDTFVIDSGKEIIKFINDFLFRNKNKEDGFVQELEKYINNKEERSYDYYMVIANSLHYKRHQLENVSEFHDGPAGRKLHNFMTEISLLQGFDVVKYDKIVLEELTKISPTADDMLIADFILNYSKLLTTASPLELEKVKKEVLALIKLPEEGPEKKKIEDIIKTISSCETMEDLKERISDTLIPLVEFEYKKILKIGAKAKSLSDRKAALNGIEILIWIRQKLGEITLPSADVEEEIKDMIRGMDAKGKELIKEGIPPFLANLGGDILRDLLKNARLSSPLTLEYEIEVIIDAREALEGHSLEIVGRYWWEMSLIPLSELLEIVNKIAKGYSEFLTGDLYVPKLLKALGDNSPASKIMREELRALGVSAINTASEKELLIAFNNILRDRYFPKKIDGKKYESLIHIEIEPLLKRALWPNSELAGLDDLDYCRINRELLGIIYPQEIRQTYALFGHEKAKELLNDILPKLLRIEREVKENMERYKKELADFFGGLHNNQSINISPDEKELLTVKYSQFNDIDDILDAAEKANNLRRYHSTKTLKTDKGKDGSTSPQTGSVGSPLTIEQEVRSFFESLPANYPQGEEKKPSWDGTMSLLGNIEKAKKYLADGIGQYSKLAQVFLNSNPQMYPKIDELLESDMSLVSEETKGYFSLIGKRNEFQEYWNKAFDLEYKIRREKKTAAASPKELEVYDGDTAKYKNLLYVPYSELGPQYQKQIMKLLTSKETVFNVKINKAGTDAQEIERLEGGYHMTVVSETMLSGMHFAIKPRGEDGLTSIEGFIDERGERVVYGKTLSIAVAIIGAWEEDQVIVSSAVVSKLDVPQKAGQWGGIDLTDRALHIKLERVGSFASTPLLLPQVKNTQDLDLDKEFAQVEALASSGIVPNSHRLLELFTVCHYRGEFGERLNQIISCLKAASAIQEAQAIDSDEDFRLALMMPEVLS